MAQDEHDPGAPAVHPPRKRPQHLEIREMELDDLPAVFALGQRLFRADEYPNLYRAWEEYELLQLYAGDAETCLVATIDDELAGFVLGTIIDKARSAWMYGYVVWLGVEPRLSRKGVASRLVEELTEQFVDDGVRMLIVDTEGSNDAAIGFFTRQGFGNLREHVYLEKNLELDDRWANEVRATREDRKRLDQLRDVRRRRRLQVPSVATRLTGDSNVDRETADDHPARREGRRARARKAREKAREAKKKKASGKRGKKKGEKAKAKDKGDKKAKKTGGKKKKAKKTGGKKKAKKTGGKSKTKKTGGKKKAKTGGKKKAKKTGGKSKTKKTNGKKKAKKGRR